MGKKMENRVYGVIGIQAIMSNWNADFTGYPKTTSKGDIFGSDKALKYPMKKLWEDIGKKVLYIKSLKLSKDKGGSITIVPRSLKERYEYLFKVEDLKKDKNCETVLKNLFSAIDVKNFGATFAEEGNNISITGAVQIGQGFNKYDDTCVDEQSILSPFRDPKAKTDKNGSDEEAKNSTLGSKIVSDEAHYFYPFTINPASYNGYVDMGITEGYTEEDYAEFKNCALDATTSYATNAKEGCRNEFALFVETENDLYLPNLDEYIQFKKGEGDEKNIIHFQYSDVLNTVKGRIKSIEVYYDPHDTVFESSIDDVRKYNIVTKEEV